MKIIGINTSPRENSNSKIALEKALGTAESKGADVKIFDLNNMNIKTCQACDYCVEHKGECSLDDDMQEIYNEIKIIESGIDPKWNEYEKDIIYNSICYFSGSLMPEE